MTPAASFAPLLERFFTQCRRGWECAGFRGLARVIPEIIHCGFARFSLIESNVVVD